MINLPKKNKASATAIAGVLFFAYIEPMKKTCQYCGVVDEDHVCPHRIKRYQKYQKGNEKDRFRSSSAWQRKREAIKSRDHYLCQVCLSGEYDTFNQFTYTSLQVHHIDSVDEHFDKRFDDDNLLTVCEYHHKMADKGIIPKNFLKSLIPTIGNYPPGRF